MDTLSKTEYKVRDLTTRSVTLFPTRAQVSREIKGVDLKTGTNEITIVGLSPTVDEDSIKVEGSGVAIITDIAVESLPNREIFEEIYPDSEAEESDDDYDSDVPDASDLEIPELKQAREQLVQLEDESARATELVNSSKMRMSVLDSYGQSLNAKTGVDIEEQLKTIKQERAKAYDDQMSGNNLQRTINTKIVDAKKEVYKQTRLNNKARAKETKELGAVKLAKEKEYARKERRRQERIKEKYRIRRARQRSWPKYCYSVRITLEVTGYTPMSSRRASIASETEFIKPSSPKTVGAESVDEALACDLLLSYVTSSAYWRPSYDLQLSTTTSSGSLCFDAQLHNDTSETWNNCKVTLSTSQATFSGLQDTIPTLVPWHIKLGYKGSHRANGDILRSQEEYNHMNSFRSQQQPVASHKSRAEMFGVPGVIGGPGGTLRHRRAAGYYTESSSQEDDDEEDGPYYAQKKRKTGPPMPTMPMPAMQMQMAPVAPVVQAPQASAAYGGRQHDKMHRMGSAIPPPPAFDGMVEGGEMQLDGSTDAADQALDFEESLVGETGFTTTYDLPGLKTLVPKSTASKQRVARIAFSSVTLSHIVVAKYKPVAYLKAKIRNSSKLTLLKGTTGLTLDGSFMGKTTLPLCSSGDFFSLSLGIDPAIKVIYARPEVKRATTGMFSKEDSSVYVRAVTLQNTRASAGKPASLVVQDQVPVSQDEKLRVEILAPRGVVVDGGSVSAGQPGREVREDRDWGKASATLKKGGLVNWDVSLNAGKAVKLALEYAVGMPSGDVAMQS